MVSSDSRRSSKTSGPSKVISAASKTARPSAQGHTYEVKRIDADERWLNNRGDHRVTITLLDVTTGKTITRRGVSKMVGNFSPIWLDSLEGHQDLYMAVQFHDVRCKVLKAPTGSKSEYWLQEI